MIKAWLLDEMFWFDRAHVDRRWDARRMGRRRLDCRGRRIPPAPANVAAKCGNGRITITWDPVPDAMYYNLYFQTTKGVKSSSLN